MREILYSRAGADQQAGDFRNFAVGAGDSRTKHVTVLSSMNHLEKLNHDLFVKYFMPRLAICCHLGFSK